METGLGDWTRLAWGKVFALESTIKDRIPPFPNGCFLNSNPFEILAAVGPAWRETGLKSARRGRERNFSKGRAHLAPARWLSYRELIVHLFAFIKMGMEAREVVLVRVRLKSLTPEKPRFLGVVGVGVELRNFRQVDDDEREVADACHVSCSNTRA